MLGRTVEAFTAEVGDSCAVDDDNVPFFDYFLGQFSPKVDVDAFIRVVNQGEHLPALQVFLAVVEVNLDVVNLRLLGDVDAADINLL